VSFRGRVGKTALRGCSKATWPVLPSHSSLSDPARAFNDLSAKTRFGFLEKADDFFDFG